MERSMRRTARIGFATALLMGGATLAVAQNGPPTGAYQPVRWNPNLYTTTPTIMPGLIACHSTI